MAERIGPLAGTVLANDWSRPSMEYPRIRPITRTRAEMAAADEKITPKTAVLVTLLIADLSLFAALSYLWE